MWLLRPDLRMISSVAMLCEGSAGCTHHNPSPTPGGRFTPPAQKLLKGNIAPPLIS